VIFVKERVCGGPLITKGEGDGKAPQPVYTTVVFARVNPAGRLSVKLTLEIDSLPGLVTVKLNVAVPLGTIVLGENDLLILALTMFA